MKLSHWFAFLIAPIRRSSSSMDTSDVPNAWCSGSKTLHFFINCIFTYSVVILRHFFLSFNNFNAAFIWMRSYIRVVNVNSIYLRSLIATITLWMVKWQRFCFIINCQNCFPVSCFSSSPRCIWGKKWETFQNPRMIFANFPCLPASHMQIPTEMSTSYFSSLLSVGTAA